MQYKSNDSEQQVAATLRKLAVITAWSTVIISAFTILGWLLSIPILASFFYGTKAIAPSAAAILIIYSVILINFNNWRRATRTAFAALVGIVLLFSVAELTSVLLHTGWSPEWALLQQIPALANLNARISPVAAMLSLIIGIMIILLLMNIQQRILRHIPGWLGLTGLISSTTFMLGYLYGAPFLYGSAIIPIAFPATLGYLLLSIAGIVSTGLDRQPLRWLVGRSKSVRLLRIFLPFTVVAILTADLMETYLGQRFHLNDALLSALFSIGFAGFAALLISFISHNVGDKLEGAERELLVEQERWRVTVHSIGDAVIATDPEAMVTMMNSVAEELTGWPEAEALGHHITEVFNIINETTRKVCINPIAEVLRQGKIIGLANHTVLISRDGTEYGIADSGSPIRDANEQIIGVVLVFRNVTEERYAEISLQASQEQFRRAIINAPIPIMLHAENGEVIALSDAWTEITGYKLSDIPTTAAWTERAYGTNKHQVMVEIEALYSMHGRKNEGMYTVTTASGERRVWDFSSASGGNLPDGRRLAISMARDITEKNKTESQQAFTQQLLTFLNSPLPDDELIPSLVQMLKKYTGIAATGLRLQHNDDYPYFYTEGFSDEFMASENSLCRYDANGQTICDESGKATLECLCASVLQHQALPGLRGHFTKAGTFWANNLPELVAATPVGELPAHLRESCPANYSSVALIPLYSGGQTIGLLQLNDPRPNFFTLKDIKFLEEISTTIGIAITRRRANISLQESEQHFRLLYENSPVSYQSLDFDGNFVDLNDSWLSLLGYQRDEVIGHWFGEFLVSEQQELFRLRFPRFIELGKVTEVEFDFICQDGHILNASIDGRIAHDTNGEFKQTHCVIHDITGRKQNEDLVKRERDQAKMYLDIAAVMIGTLDSLGNITMLNHRGCQLLGYGEEELLGKNWFETCVPADQREKVSSLFHNMVAGSEPISKVYENQVITRTGERRLVFFQNTAITYDTDRILGILFSGEDITERTNAEEQLRQATKMESIGRLAGGVAHDFNNILTGILGMTQLAQMKTPVDSPLQTDLEEIINLSERAANLTRQLLTFSRRQPITPQPVNINDLITNSMKMLGRLIGEDVTFSFIPTATPATACVDVGQIEQLLMNLAINARDAMPYGGSLKIVTENTFLDDCFASSRMGVIAGEYLQITITDTGEGMDAETQGRIFEPFFTTKEVGKGTGLGLATVYGIVKQHKGNIWVYSEKGHGTTFKIYLPAYNTNENEDGSLKQHPVISTIPQRGNDRILLVEDEDSVRKVARRILEDNGYNVQVASSADEAEELFSLPDTHFDLLLTDVIMPRRSGIELYRVLKEVEPQLKVLFMSGYSVFNLQETLIPSFDAILLQKPFTRESLLNRVRVILDGEIDPV